MKVAVSTVVAAVALSFASLHANANLIYSDSTMVSGTGLGAVSTLVTVQDSVTPSDPPPGPIESGCVSFDNAAGGSATNFACLNGLSGQDNAAQNNTYLLSNLPNLTSAGDLAAVVNIAETGQDLTVKLTDLYLSLYTTTGTLLANFQYLGPDLMLTQGSGTGLGGSGFVFILDDAQRAEAILKCPVLTACVLGGGVQFGAGTTNNGPETLFVTSVPGQGSGGDTGVPEPATIALLGAAFVGMAAISRRRRMR